MSCVSLFLSFFLCGLVSVPRPVCWLGGHIRAGVAGSTSLPFSNLGAGNQGGLSVGGLRQSKIRCLMCSVYGDGFSLLFSGFMTVAVGIGMPISIPMA